MITLIKKSITTYTQKGLYQTLRLVYFYIRKKTFGSHRVLRLRLKKYINQHNDAYAHISGLVCDLNQGIHPKHRIINYHKFFVDHVSPSDRVLDLGCGNGYLTHSVAQKAQHVTGIDFDKRHVYFARKRFARDNIDFVCGDVLTYPFKHTFDVIVFSNVLEHLKNRVSFLTSLHKLAPKILLRVPMITRDWLVVYKKEMGFEYRLDHTHETEFTLEQLKQETGAAGWHITAYQVNWGEWWGVLQNKKEE